MPKFIFSNASYLITYNCPGEIEDYLKEQAKEKGFKLADDKNVDDLITTLDKVKYFIDTYIFLPGVPQEELDQIISKCEERGTNFILFNPDTQEIPSKYAPHVVRGDLNQFYMQATFNVRDRGRMPEGLPDFSAVCVNYIFPFIFRDIKTNWSLSDTEIDDPDFLTLCENSFESTTGRFVLKVNEEKLRENSAEIADLEQRKVEDYFREFMNQYIGIVNFNFIQMDIKARITIPQSYDRNSKVNLGKIYFPEIILKDEKGIFSLTLGYIDHSGKPLFSYKGIGFSSPDDEVEFL